MNTILNKRPFLPLLTCSIWSITIWVNLNLWPLQSVCVCVCVDWEHPSGHWLLATHQKSMFSLRGHTDKAYSQPPLQLAVDLWLSYSQWNESGSYMCYFESPPLETPLNREDSPGRPWNFGTENLGTERPWKLSIKLLVYFSKKQTWAIIHFGVMAISLP